MSLGKKIRIEIPDDLSPAKEAKAIFKELFSKKYLGKNQEQKRIGKQELTMRHLTTDIEIVRVAPPEPVMIQCHCGVLYKEKEGVKYFTNVGGLVKQRTCCSKDCVNVVISIAGHRAALTRKKISTAFLIR